MNEHKTSVAQKRCIDNLVLPPSRKLKFVIRVTRINDVRVFHGSLANRLRFSCRDSVH